MSNVFFTLKQGLPLSVLCDEIAQYKEREKNYLDKATYELLGKMYIHNCLDPSILLTSIAPLRTADENSISFLANAKYNRFLAETNAAICVVKESDMHYARNDQALIVCDDPMRLQSIMLDLMYVDKCLALNMRNRAISYKRISDTARITGSASVSSTTHICDNSYVGASSLLCDNVFIGANVSIGSNCIIEEGAHIDHYVSIGDGTRVGRSSYIGYAKIGSKCDIGSGARIGNAGFGFPIIGDRIYEMKQVGDVIIGDNVRIGANTCIDRGSIGSTKIDDNTKIDNLVQIGHNVQIGRNCLIAAQAGIAGSAEIGSYCMIGGQVGIAGHLKIGNMVMIAAQSGVMNDIADRQKIGGSPAMPVYKWHRMNALLRSLISS